jgi:hypothetical protein
MKTISLLVEQMEVKVMEIKHRLIQYHQCLVLGRNNLFHLIKLLRVPFGSNDCHTPIPFDQF